MSNELLVTLTADIVSAHVANNSVALSDVGVLVQKVHESLSTLGQVIPEPVQAKSPVVSIRASIKPDHLVCLECGRNQKMLKRHIWTSHGLTPAQYRADYNLPGDYPMVAANYSARRSALAHAIGLGRKKGDSASSSPAPQRRTRRPAGRPARGRKPAK